MRIHRMIAILLILESRGQVKAKDLAEALETSIRTIHRDIAALCEAGIPLTASTGPNGGISLMDGYSTQMSSMQCDDIINLFLSGTGIHPDDNSEAGHKLQKALLNLEKTLPPKYLSDIKIAKERFYFDSAPWWSEKMVLPFLDVLRKSVWQCKKISIQYRKLNGEASSRVVQPYGLVVKSMVWYLVGLCERSNEIRIFKCDRMMNVSLREETFTYPESFSLEEFWKSSSKEFVDACLETELYPVEVKIPLRYSTILQNHSVISQTIDNGTVRAILNLHKYEFATEEVLSLIGMAEILSPQELRQYASNKLLELADYYVKLK